MVPEEVMLLETDKVPPTLDEALEMKPPCRVASPVARKVDETVVAPEMETVPPKLDDELLTMRPLLIRSAPTLN